MPKLSQKEYLIEKSKFMKEYFSKYGLVTKTEDNIYVLVLESENPIELLDNINFNITKDLTNYIEKTLKQDPKLYDRSTTYETEIKDNKIFIRWV